MIKGKEILGKNIVSISTGQRVDAVRDVVFDHQANQVLGLLVDEGGWFRAARVVPFERIRSFGEDAIMIGDASDLTTSREDGRLADMLENKISLMGMTLLTTDGQNLGKIADVYFDEQSGRVEGYEATGGLFADLSNGRTFVPAPESVQIGADAAIVPVGVAAAMQEQEGGAKSALHAAGESLTQAYHSAADTVRGGVEQATAGAGAPGDHLNRAADAPGGRIVEVYAPVHGQPTPEPARGAAGGETASESGVLGRRVRHEVRAGGRLIAAPGQIVTPGLLARARENGVEAELLSATTAGGAATGPSAAEGAGHLLDRAKQWFSERREETEQAIQERQQAVQEAKIRDALGRPVTRVILTPEDHVILNVGEIITHKAVQVARDADVLDILLDSVSKEPVSLDPLATRPNETGEAALDSQANLDSRQD
ncbi:PRC-barrel domain-containing protein [Deinococcus hohokamensis]|uniref:PRC-barrel domain-containing protein n=1 Tax=Deinococcus hohokamensis TaxID=309883 RepID=A0ABV9IDB7_9DEIO